MAFAGSLVSLLSLAPAPAQADILCTQFGADTFHIGSTLKFQWNDTQSISLETFNLNLYCEQNNKMVQTITTLNMTSPSPVTWVVNSTLSAFSQDCTLNQYRGAFDWIYDDPDTGVSSVGSGKCKVILLVGTGAATPSPGSASADDPLPADDPQPSDIVVSDRTKSIVIGVGCAVGALVLAGFVGFYVIRYSNKRAAEDQSAKKLREPISTGPLFPPMDRSHQGGAAGATAGGKAARYNELASVTTGSPATTSRTAEMVELGGVTRPGSTQFLSPALGSRSPTPIAAAHAKLGSSIRSPSSSSGTFQNDRPGSLLTSTFVPSDDSYTRSPSSHKNPFEKRENLQLQYEQEMQQQQHQLQHQQQQQQQQQNYGSYPY
ncbi:hypothetical protein BGZ54_008462 [Gamsiella multidivaricata]|nr:hypothetical protein BGZ54_008462 [Gamsiella multidivaricata]